MKVLKRLKATTWKALYNRWPDDREPLRPGYAIMLLTPGDLPVFLDIAVRVFKGMKADHLVETLVIPDKMPPGFMGRYEWFKAHWPLVPPGLVRFPPLDRAMVASMNHSYTNCWLQLVNGTRAARAKYALWHDADLFLTAPHFLEEHYAGCVAGDLACRGINPAWDATYRELGLGHVTATWEMMFNVAWLRSFRPWQLRGHDTVVAGRPMTCDITYLPQTRTPPEKVGRHEGLTDDDFVHFNFVFGDYRAFQNTREPFEDHYFRILLVRLLIDAFDHDPKGWPYDAPTVDELAAGLADPSRRVTYTGPETRGHFAEFRAKLQRLIDGPLVDDRERAILRAGVAPFERAFG